MKRPQNNILVVYTPAKDGTPDPKSIKCYHNKRILISPFKKRAYLDLTPYTLPISLKNAPTLNKYRFNLEGNITVEISTDPKLMNVAGEKLVGLKREQISELATYTIINHMRIAVAEFNIEDINLERDRFFSAIAYEVENGLNSIGMKAVNYSYSDMSDENGYFVEYGRQQVLKAIEQAKAEIEREKKEYSPDEGV